MTKQPILPTSVIDSLKDSTAANNIVIHTMEQLKLMRIFSTLGIKRRNSADNLSQNVARKKSKRVISRSSHLFHCPE